MPYDKDDLANIFALNCEETLILEEQSRSKLDKELIKKNVLSLEKEVDELESEKAEFLEKYDLLFQECLSKDIMCVILCFFDDIDEQTKMSCLYLEKIEECKNLELELSKCKSQQTDKHFAILEQHYIELELALQHQKEKNVYENSWVKHSLISGDTEKALKDKIDSLIAELNRKTVE
ncbi:hypothetical protein Tco_0846997 [Tanacetum coccineum]